MNTKDKLSRVVSIIICISILYSSCAEKMTNNEIAQSNFGVDIMKLQPKDEDVGEDEMMAREQKFNELFRKIYTNKSETADNVVGTIAGKKIVARYFELQALKTRESGSRAPYKDAWEALRLEVAEEQFIKTKNLEKGFSRQLRQYNDELKAALVKDEQLQMYYHKQRTALGMSKKSYLAFMTEANRRICRHYFVEKYLSQHNIKTLNAEKIEVNILDKDYKKVIHPE